MAGHEILKISGLTLNYGKKPALKDLNLSLQSGEIAGLIGANGSGKTTLMRAVSGLLTNWSGSVEIDGEKDGWKAKKDICYLPSNPYADDSLRVREAIRLFTELFPEYDAKLAGDLFRQFGYSMTERISELSRGRKALTMFILHLARKAKLYLLDEPFSGIDIRTREEMKEVLLSFASPQKSFLISTHEVSDMESLFDRIVIIKEGGIVINEESDALRARFGKTFRDLAKEVI